MKLKLKKKHYQQQIAILFGAVAMLSYLAVRFFPEEPSTLNVVADVDQTSVMAYLLDQENTLVPVSFQMDPSSKIEDKVKAAVDRMNGTIPIDNFRPLFTTDCKLNSVQIEENSITLDFNQGFTSYEEKQELRVLEAITWTATQFSDIKQVKLQLDGTPLSKMPLANTPIPEVLNRSIGINHFENTSTSLHQSSEITVYYVKDIGGKEFMVPKSKRIEGNDPDMAQIVKEIMADVSVSSGLRQPLYNDNIDIGDLPRIQNGVMSVSVNENILASDATAKAHAYDALVLSLSEIMGVDQIQVSVDDVIVTLHGSNEDIISVSSLKYNEVGI